MKKCLPCNERFGDPGWKCPRCGFAPESKNGRWIFAPELSLQNDGFHVEDFELLSRAERDHFWFQSRNRLILWAIRRFFPGTPDFFEIGCGNGYVLEWLEKKEPRLALSGSEVYGSALDYAGQRLEKTTLFQMDARKIPFDNEFNLIGAFDVLEHIKEDETVLTQMYQAVKKGGGVILTVPQHKFLWSDSDKFSFHYRRYEADELRGKVEKAGFVFVAMSSFVSLLLPFMLVSRWMSKGKIKEIGPKVELEIAPILNFVFKRVLDIERALIRMGLRLPFGGSLLLIAKKI